MGTGHGPSRTAASAHRGRLGLVLGISLIAVVLAFATIALVGNAIALSLLVAGQSKSLNIRGAYLEVLSDLVGAGVVVIASSIIKLTWNQVFDAIAGIVIGLMILPHTWTLLRYALDVLVEATPRHIDLDVVREHLLAVEGSAHVVISEATLTSNTGERCSTNLMIALMSTLKSSTLLFDSELVATWITKVRWTRNRNGATKLLCYKATSCFTVSRKAFSNRWSSDICEEMAVKSSKRDLSERSLNSRC